MFTRREYILDFQADYMLLFFGENTVFVAFFIEMQQYFLLLEFMILFVHQNLSIAFKYILHCLMISMQPFSILRNHINRHLIDLLFRKPFAESSGQYTTGI